MHDELVKRLRNRRICIQQLGTLNDYPLLVEAADAIEELTGFVQEAERDRDEYRERLDKANDAIEELSKDRDSMNEANIALYGALPKWIPVTERLPEFEGAVLCMRKSNVYGVRPHQEILYVDEYGFKNYDDIYLADGVVTHWMPLPQPPKEET